MLQIAQDLPTLDSPRAVIGLLCSLIIALSVMAVIAAVIIDFALYNGSDSGRPVKRSQRSVVTTASMFGFYLLYYLVLESRVGSVRPGSLPSALLLPLVVAGSLIVLFGAVVNILGRLALKDNWANHIKIYQQHTLIDFGVYRIVRHPLYASLIWMFFGGSLAYANWLAAFLTAAVFVPSMYNRAQQEETLLIQEFSGYTEYRQRTGMFFPKIKPRR